MNRDEVLSLFREAGAILEGHFILTSGLRSPVFLQKARVFMYPDKTEKLCKALAEKIKAADLGPIDYIVSPALGGLIPGYETARHLEVPAMWVEREDGEFRLRRFDLPQGARVIVVEDIVTTGLSSRETVTSLKALGAEVLGVACLIDRSGGEADASVPIIALAEYKVPAYEPNNLPPELAALPAVKPGSRGLS
ncbi:MAG: orotate phosphoribosyltransferase [Roseibium sp.]|uniref:orotate phosphoribosyltransferase n=1 Tax=Roseibium sp. TaxID=1936156 RepID=UPI00263921FC|nr:orotate phosphoribosyltransferase [Roseibium sp.]MCV0429896.1 orotate phosphoribosyltransferase [Roseibium sp.]